MFDQERDEVEAEAAALCGVLHATTAALVALLARVLAAGAWEGAGIRSPVDWVTCRFGISTSRAPSWIRMAERLDELPSVFEAFRAGELAEDQVAVLVRYLPAHNDADGAALAKELSVPVLRRTLRDYPAQPPDEEEPEPEKRSTTFWFREEGTFPLSAELPADEGALVERALGSARDELVAEHAAGDEPVTCRRAGAPERALPLGCVGARRRALPGGGPRAGRPPRAGRLGAPRPRPPLVRAPLPLVRRQPSPPPRGRDRAGGPGPAIPHRAHRPASGHRGPGPGLPRAGCAAQRWLHVHHLTHWEDGGTTDPENLVCLCSAHHRAHHRGALAIEGDPTTADGLVVTDTRTGRVLTHLGGRSPPTTGTPSDAARALGVPEASWVHPSGERLDRRWLQLPRAG